MNRSQRARQATIKTTLFFSCFLILKFMAMPGYSIDCHILDASRWPASLPCDTPPQCCGEAGARGW